MTGANRPTAKIVPASANEWRELYVLLGHHFTPHHPVDDQELFTGRLDLISEVEDAVGLRGRHAIIYGDRGVGKTSFANLLETFLRLPNERIKCVKRLASAEHKYASIWHDLLSDFRWEERTAKQLLGDTKNPTEVIELLEALPRNQRTIFIIDEFDRIKDKQTKVLLSDTLKNISDNLRHISIVIVGIARNINELFENHESLPRALKQIYMPRMSREELTHIVEDRIPPLGMTITRSATQNIVAMSDGFPGYTHLITLNAARHAVKRRSVDVVQTDLDQAMTAIVRDADEAIAEAYDQAVSSSRANMYRQVLLACALARTDEKNRFTPSAVTAPLSKILGRSVTTATFNKNLDKFCQEGRGPVLMREGTRKRYRFHFCLALLRPYVIMRGLADGTIEPKHVR
ncbi:MAG TPA: hypothetical protein DHW63_12110 [Hyphomonadaceae bacterium]|nr:hypothetical protein [Hyphomonadaceae bacterium]